MQPRGAVATVANTVLAEATTPKLPQVLAEMLHAEKGSESDGCPPGQGLRASRSSTWASRTLFSDDGTVGRGDLVIFVLSLLELLLDHLFFLLKLLKLFEQLDNVVLAVLFGIADSSTSHCSQLQQ